MASANPDIMNPPVHCEYFKKKINSPLLYVHIYNKRKVSNTKSNNLIFS